MTVSLAVGIRHRSSGRELTGSRPRRSAGGGRGLPLWTRHASRVGAGIPGAARVAGMVVRLAIGAGHRPCRRELTGCRPCGRAGARGDASVGSRRGASMRAATSTAGAVASTRVGAMRGVRGAGPDVIGERRRAAENQCRAGRKEKAFCGEAGMKKGTGHDRGARARLVLAQRLL